MPSTPATPRSARPNGAAPASNRAMKPRRAADRLSTPRQKDGDDGDDDEEARIASQFLAEVMVGTPRANAHPLPNPLGSGLYPKKQKEMLPTPLPPTIQSPSIVLQHSMKPAQEVKPDEGLIARYDYLTPAEMQAQLAAQDAQGSAPDPGSAVCATAALDEPPPETEEGWYVDQILARRRLKGDDAGQPGSWQYLVRWIGRGPEDDMWVPEGDLDPELIASELQEAATERAMLSARGEAAA